MSEEKPVHQLKLNSNGVVAPVLRAVQETLEVLSISVGAVRTADLSQPLGGIGSGSVVRFEGDQRNLDERRVAYLN